MIGYTSASCFTQIESEIQAVRTIRRPQYGLCPLSQSHNLCKSVWVQKCQGIKVPMRDDQNVAGCVWEGIETDKAVGGTMNYERRVIGVTRRHSLFNGVIGGCSQVTKDAVLVIFCRPGAKRGWNPPATVGFRATYIAVAPRRPESVHMRSISADSVALPPQTIEFVARRLPVSSEIDNPPC